MNLKDDKLKGKPENAAVTEMNENELDQITGGVSKPSKTNTKKQNNPGIFDPLNPSYGGSTRT